ncbi:conserved hypothetical protein [Culex quinquefasciatus]|uniref:Uncharacterized protein n=1 Tax=Culex quinquefasciatus TaxID=7176 RepID=B0X265_CULQU|nr:conserved hypothetical protein [Culex quinquefasciatus]|eukprot:XP_001863737.1 conserved hypothetical protein [Culex quinquefasciatus]
MGRMRRKKSRRVALTIHAISSKCQKDDQQQQSEQQSTKDKQVAPKEMTPPQDPAFSTLIVDVNKMESTEPPFNEVSLRTSRKSATTRPPSLSCPSPDGTETELAELASNVSGMHGDVSTTQFHDGQVLDVVSGHGLRQGFLIHFDGLDISGQVDRNEDDGDTGLVHIGFRSRTTDFGAESPTNRSAE